MPAWNPQANDIFLAALEITSASERTAYVKSACGDKPELLAQVQALLAASEKAGSFLDAPHSGVAIDPGPTTAGTAAERPGMQIGPYKLLQVIGEGGMGVVYMAEQKEPVERKVALKIIKPGMDSAQVIARFEAERQALALMDHPNIAKIFDAGVTGQGQGVRDSRLGAKESDAAGRPSTPNPEPRIPSSGRPYFVMELVKGVPITKYCDEKHLSLKERLELMIPVCQAIQHAHQKGIIHRDIKPTNVLVAQYDGKPVPKVIDFGVAKATAQKLTERTMFTELGQIVGTLEYMSPEQAELNQLDIDTRSDIYSLGVLLYELLTGSTPLDKQKLRTAAFHEMLRIIREDEPPKPSTRLSTIDTLASIAAVRGTEPARLSKLVRGELDWIVMKALDKDRRRRYETASAFAADVQRYLNDEPVQACPPTAGYRIQKLFRKNKAALTTAALVVMALLLGTVVSTLQAIRATRAETQAKANEARALVEEQKAKAAAAAEAEQRRVAQQRAQVLEQRHQLLLQNDRVNTMLIDEILAVLRDPQIGEAKRHTIFVTALKRLTKLDPRERVEAYHNAGNTFVRMQEYPAAISAYTEALALNPRHTKSYISRGDVYFQQQQFDKAVNDYTSAIENRSKSAPSDDQLPYARRGFAWCRLQNFDQALADFQASFDAKPGETLSYLEKGFRGRVVNTAPFDSQIQPGVIALFDRLVSQNRSPAMIATCINGLGELGQWAEVRKHLQAERAADRVGTGVDYLLAALALKCDDRGEYRRLCSEMIEKQAGSKRADTAFTAGYACALAPRALDDYAPVIAIGRQAVSRNPKSAQAHLGLGAALLRAGHFDEAYRELEAALDAPFDMQPAACHGPFLLAIACYRLGRAEEATKWLAQAKERASQAEADRDWTWRGQVALELLRDETIKLISGAAADAGVTPRQGP